jgi:phage FluMu gp28-like protein
MSSWYNEGIGVKIAKFTEETGHTAADIIQDAEIVAELKKNNPKLIEYLSNNQTILDELIGYVSELPA